jgi:hypothetical protein
MSDHMGERIAPFETGYKLVMASLATANSMGLDVLRTSVRDGVRMTDYTSHTLPPHTNVFPVHGTNILPVSNIQYLCTQIFYLCRHKYFTSVYHSYITSAHKYGASASHKRLYLRVSHTHYLRTQIWCLRTPQKLYLCMTQIFYLRMAQTHNLHTQQILYLHGLQIYYFLIPQIVYPHIILFLDPYLSDNEL